MRFYLAALLCSLFAVSVFAQSDTLSVSSETAVSSAAAAEPAISSAARTSPVPAVAVSSAPVLGEGPWMVCDIAATGLLNTKKSLVTKNVKAKKGQLYEQSFVSQDIQALIGLGNYEIASVDISVMPDEKPVSTKTGLYPCHRITYILTERPVIREVLVEGRKKLSRSTIIDEMSLKEKDPYDRSKMSDDVIKITDKYKSKGYINASVDYSVTQPDAANKVSLTVKVTEGAQARVKTVTFDGLASFKKKKVMGETKNKEGKVFSEKDLPEDRKNIENLYLNGGFSQFRIADSSITFNADSSEVYIKYTISEGPKSKFGSTTFTGNTVFSSEELAKSIYYRKGKTFQQEKLTDAVRALQELYADKGYLKAQVRPNAIVSSATSTIDITFDIAENTIVYVDHVDVSGYKATKPYVLKREVVVKEGDVFRSSRIRKSQEKLMNLGFLDDVQIDIQPTPDPDKVDVAFDVAEGKPGMLTMGAAVSSTDGLYGQLGITHMNLFGRAQKLSLNWSFGAKVMDYTLSWSTPWIYDRPITFGTDLFNTRRYRAYGSDSQAYTEKRTGGRLRLGPRFEEDKYQLNLAYTYEDVNISDVQTAYIGQIMEGTSATSSISAEFAVDTRDYIWDPTRGWRNSVSLEIAGGPLMGDLDYYKTGLSSSYSHTLFSIDEYPIVWGMSNRFGLVGRYGDTDAVPVYEKYFIGGADTVRGYSSSGQVGDPDGGQIYYVMNTEIRFPLAREKRRTIIQGAFFYDLGSSWNKFSDITPQIGSGQDMLKSGAGIGIRFTTPAFPIRLDWGYGFNHKSGETLTEFYFTIGNLF